MSRSSLEALRVRGPHTVYADPRSLPRGPAMSDTQQAGLNLGRVGDTGKWGVRVYSCVTGSSVTQGAGEFESMPLFK